MIKIFRSLFPVLLFVCGCFTSLHAQKVLTVEVSNISSQKGKILLALYNRSEGFPDVSTKAIALKEIPAIKGNVYVKFDGLLPATYALAVFHDKNSDGELNTNLVGIPKEDYGFSNNARPGFRAPTFKEAAFRFDKDVIISVTIK